MLTNKAYLNTNLHNLKNTIIYQLAKGLGISAWSEHMLYYCLNSIEEARDITLGREIISGCYTSSQNHKFNVLDQTLFCRQRPKPYKVIITQTKIVRCTQHTYYLVIAMSANSYNYWFLQNNRMTVI